MFGKESGMYSGRPVHGEVTVSPAFITRPRDCGDDIFGEWGKSTLLFRVHMSKGLICAGRTTSYGVQTNVIDANVLKEILDPKCRDDGAFSLSAVAKEVSADIEEVAGSGCINDEVARLFVPNPRPFVLSEKVTLLGLTSPEPVYRDVLNRISCNLIKSGPLRLPYSMPDFALPPKEVSGHEAFRRPIYVIFGSGRHDLHPSNDLPLADCFDQSNYEPFTVRFEIGVSENETATGVMRRCVERYYRRTRSLNEGGKFLRVCAQLVGFVMPGRLQRIKNNGQNHLLIENFLYSPSHIWEKMTEYGSPENVPFDARRVGSKLPKPPIPQTDLQNTVTVHRATPGAADIQTEKPPKENPRATAQTAANAGELVRVVDRQPQVPNNEEFLQEIKIIHKQEIRSLKRKIDDLEEKLKAEPRSKIKDRKGPVSK